MRSAMFCESSAPAMKPFTAEHAEKSSLESAEKNGFWKTPATHFSPRIFLRDFCEISASSAMKSFLTQRTQLAESAGN